MLLAVSLVVFALSLAAALVIPSLQSAARHARSAAVSRDVRAFLPAFQAYTHDHGDWPAAANAPGEYPPGMEKYLSHTAWKNVTPLDGHYAWLVDTPQRGERLRAVIAIVSVAANNVTTDTRQLAELDHELDDGSPDTGRMRLGFHHYPIYVVEP
jgi:type II secretory pathway pseudopilin PulG